MDGYLQEQRLAQDLPPQERQRRQGGGPDVLAGVAGRHWFWVIAAILSWRGFWLVMAHNGEDNRYILITYSMLYITYMLLKYIDEGEMP